jgi:excinuclease ABC subunit B
MVLDRADEGATPSYFAKPHLDDMGHDPTTPADSKTLFRRNTLDEMTVGRTEKPVVGHVPEKPDAAKGTQRFSPLLEGQPERDDGVRPLVRGKMGVGSYEDPGEQKRKGRTKGKTGRPGR